MAKYKIKMQITGRVQGVGFRYSALTAAKKLGITGQVWNNDDGSVGIRAQSDSQNRLSTYEALVRDNFQHSPWIHVSYVEVSTDDAPDFSDFSITR